MRTRGLLLIAVVLETCFAASSPYLPVRGSAWRLASGDLDGDGSNELVYGAYEGAVRAIKPATGHLLWEAALDGFPFAVAAADVNGDRRAEVFAATAGGTLYAFTSSGKLMWTHHSDRPLYNVAVGKDTAGRPFVACGGMERKVQVLSAAGKLVAEYPASVLVHRLAVADMDGDGVSEILVFEDRNSAVLLKLNGSRLERVWRKQLRVPESFRNWENPAGNFYAFSLDVGDLDGDGRPDIALGDTYFNKQAVMTVSAGLDARWLSPMLPRSMAKWAYTPETGYDFYSTAWVRIAEADAKSPGREVISVAGGNLRIFSAEGELLASSESELGFTDIVIDGRTMYLGSTPNGDETIYRLSLDSDLAKSFAGLRRQGLARQVGDNLERLRKQALAAAAVSAPDDEIHNFNITGAGRTAEACERAAGALAEFHKLFPYDRVRPIAGMKVIEPAPPLDESGKPWNPSRWRTDSINGTMTADQIVEAARLIERYRVPTLFNMGHSCMPFITLATAERMLQAAPKYLVGFLSAEDEDFREFPRYASQYFGPLADLCARYGNKQAITKNKGVWWMSVPAVPGVAQSLFDSKRRGALVACTEDSNSRTPEINLFARVGLRQAGLIDRFMVSIHQDLFSFNRFCQWEYPKSGDPYLRLLIAQTVSGGADYEMRVPWSSGRSGAIELTRLGRESVEIFAHLLGKGLVFTPRPGQMAGLSPVGFAMHEPSQKWREDAHNGHRPQAWTPDPELDQAAFPHNGCVWGMSPTPAHAVQRILFHKTRQFGYYVPPTPYGLVAIVPAHADLTKVQGVSEWWHTDGTYVWREGGPKLSGMKAAEEVRRSFESAAQRLPFRVTGDDVFFQAVRLANGRYRLYAIDPGWLDPRERRVRLHVQAPGRYAVRDLLSGESIVVRDGAVEITVPAGAVRILEAIARPNTEAGPVGYSLILRTLPRTNTTSAMIRSGMTPAIVNTGKYE